MRRRFLGQPPQDLLLLGRGQERRAPGVGRAGQPVVTRGPVRPDPLVDGDGMDPEEAGHVGLLPPLVDLLHRQTAASFLAGLSSRVIHDAGGVP